jgi:hypothetical protein
MMALPRKCNGNAKSRLIHELSVELDRVCGGVTGNDGGCIPPWIDPATGKIVFHTIGRNPWIGK